MQSKESIQYTGYNTNIVTFGRNYPHYILYLLEVHEEPALES